MTQKDLTVLNLGKSLDDLANLDPRGYGVCKILYSEAAGLQSKPLCMNAAQKLVDTVKSGDLVYILTGFVLSPWNKAETDGAVGAMLLCRALRKAFNAKPVVVCPLECRQAVYAMAQSLSMSVSEDLNEGTDIGLVIFTKDANQAPNQADRLIAKACPKAVVSIECPGCNAQGAYHNATGVDVTALQAKQDMLFEKLQAKGILDIAIGDLGNEIGLGSIQKTLNTYIPGGKVIGVRTKTDNLITATVSHWGGNAMIAAMAFLLEDASIMHSRDQEMQVLEAGSQNGLVDMYGQHIPAVDGFGPGILLPITELMGNMVARALELRQTCMHWFDKVEGLGFFSE